MPEVTGKRSRSGYYRGMPVSVDLQTVHPRKLAAVRREVAPGAVGSAWGPALGKVWEFIRSQPGLRTDGHNIFLYHRPTQPGAPILCDFGVEVTRTFETAGEVYATETQGYLARRNRHRAHDGDARRAAIPISSQRRVTWH
jgi:hypothetical protein